jgi:fructokinase
MNDLYGGIEAGGTKFVCAIASGPDRIVAEATFPTTTPAETIGQAIAFFRDHQAQYPLKGLGIATFGPVDLDPASTTWGYITTTPKPGWGQTPFATAVRAALGLPVGFDTDVNGAALSEARWGAGQGADPVVYFTIGTGIGGGALVNGRLLHGLLHPEMGHMRLKRDPALDPFPGSCHFHGDCWEGLASGPALEKRWGQKGQTLPLDHPGWALQANYIAQALVNSITILSPQRIILGGGVMGQAHLFPMIREQVKTLLNGYIQSQTILEGLDGYIVPPGLGSRAGVMGAIALAMDAAG